MAPALWQLPSATAEPSACGQLLLAQSGAQLGATMSATIVTTLKIRSGHAALRISLAFGILLLRYALNIAASTAPSRATKIRKSSIALAVRIFVDPMIAEPPPHPPTLSMLGYAS